MPFRALSQAPAWEVSPPEELNLAGTTRAGGKSLTEGGKLERGGDSGI